MGSRSFIAVMAALAVIALLAFGLFKAEPSVAIGEVAPDRELPLLSGEGTTSLADQRGSWVLVNLWASWCPPCEAESPDIQGYLERHQERGFEVYGVNSRDSTDAGREFATENELTWTMVRDGDGKYAADWAATGQPESYLVDPEGRVALICRGPLTRAQLEQLVTPLLRTGEPSDAEVPGCV